MRNKIIIILLLLSGCAQNSGDGDSGYFFPRCDVANAETLLRIEDRIAALKEWIPVSGYDEVALRFAANELAALEAERQKCVDGINATGSTHE